MEGLTDCGGPAAEYEQCDGLDNNCDGFVDEGFPNHDTDAMADCVDNDDDNDGELDVEDCAPTDPAINHFAEEVCDMVDNNCNNLVDEEGAGECLSYYFDNDNDSYGTLEKCLCYPMGKYVALLGNDCNDSDALVNPGAPEDCDTTVDDNCDGQINEESAVGCNIYMHDGDGDAYAFDVADTRCLCSPDTVTGYTTTLTGDCNDTDPLVNPGASETCGPVDENCNGSINEPNAVGCLQYYYDGDGDLWGISGSALKCICAAGDIPGYIGLFGGDCDDTRADVHPNLADPPDTGLTFVDANCDGIDGELAKAVFVSISTGADTNTCTVKTAPCKTIGKGIEVAKAQGRLYVLIAAGTYPETFTVQEGISLYGAYSPTDWSRASANVSLVEAGHQTLAFWRRTSSCRRPSLISWLSKAKAPALGPLVLPSH